jgi:hypothetical protein
MNHVKLAFLINDTIDAIERSKLGALHCTDKEGNILRDANGFPFYNMAAVHTLNVLLQSQIIERAIKYED